MSIGIPQCATCKHFRPEVSDRTTCDAFPDDWIPDEIILGEFDHTQPHEGDHGIRYEPIEKTP